MTPNAVRLSDDELARLTRIRDAGLEYLVSNRPEGGLRVVNFPGNVESPNVSLLVDSDGYVVSGHNREELLRILAQVERSSASARPVPDSGDSAPRQKQSADVILGPRLAGVLRSVSREPRVDVLHGWHMNVVSALNFLIEREYVSCNEDGTQVWLTNKARQELQL
jgi:hypothetical protein